MPETTENFHWIPVKDAGSFVQDSFRQMTLSESKGIHARVGKLKSDPEGSTVVQSYYFDKDKWSMEEAQKWVKDHKKSSASGIERRCLLPEMCEMRLDFSDKSPKIRGYAAIFEQKTQLYEGFFEKVAQGAFRDSIKGDDIRALWNHNPDYLLGRNKSETLRLWEDSKGLAYEIIPPDTSWAGDLLTLIKRGDVSQSSFGFNIVKQQTDMDHDQKEMTRTLRTVKLFDVSPVTFPAYPQTSVTVRMTKFDNEGIYVVEDEVIEVTEPRTVVQLPSDEEMANRYEALKRKVL